MSQPFADPHTGDELMDAGTFSDLHARMARPAQLRAKPPQPARWSVRSVPAARSLPAIPSSPAASAALEAASAELKDFTQQASDNDAERQKAQEIFYALEAQLTEARRQLAEMNLESTRTKGRLESQVRQASDIEQRMTRAPGEVREGVRDNRSLRLINHGGSVR